MDEKPSVDLERSHIVTRSRRKDGVHRDVMRPAGAKDGRVLAQVDRSHAAPLGIKSKKRPHAREGDGSLIVVLP
jgi:hypothetical protein